MKTNDKDKNLLGPTEQQMRKLREELSRRISREEIDYAWHLEALDRMIAILQVDPATFHRFWIHPLLAAGVSLEVAIACIADSHFQPN